jgi:hypothetical protein
VAVHLFIWWGLFSGNSWFEPRPKYRLSRHIFILSVSTSSGHPLFILYVGRGINTVDTSGVTSGNPSSHCACYWQEDAEKFWTPIIRLIILDLLTADCLARVSDRVVCYSIEYLSDWRPDRSTDRPTNGLTFSFSCKKNTQVNLSTGSYLEAIPLQAWIGT